MTMGHLVGSARPTPAVRRADSNLGPAYHPLLIVLIAVSAGIVAGGNLGPLAPGAVWWLWITACVSLIVWHFEWRRERFTSATVVLLLALAAVGAAWHHVRWNLFADDEIGRFATETPQPTCVEAIVASGPRRAAPLPPDPMAINRPPPTRLLVDVTAIRDRDTWRTASGRARLWVDGELANVRVGDRLLIYGQLAAISPPLNPGEFDFAAHARADRQLCSLRAESPDCVQLVARGSAWSLWQWVDALRTRGQAILLPHLSTDQRGLASALLLGYREQIDRDSSDAFLKTGTVHILSISGLHVAILAWLLFVALRAGFMSRRLALAMVVLVSGAYMLLSGAEPPVVRATLLVWIACGGLWMGRPGLALNGLALAALVALVINPADVFRIGVQLSFLSAGVLMWVTPKIARWPARDPLERLIDATRPWPVRAARAIGLAAIRLFVAGAVIWLIVTPLTMARFHLISPVGLLLNVALAPLVTVAMVSGFGLLLLGWVPVLGPIMGWCCETSLTGVQSTVDFAATLPGAYFWVAGPSGWWLAVFYFGIAAALPLGAYFQQWTIPRRWQVAVVGGCCGAVLVTMLPQSPGGGALRCTFVAVGHGCAVLVELPDGKTLLYDAGRQGSPAAAARAVSATLWEHRISSLDMVVVSHSDSDHFNGLPEVLERTEVCAVYASHQLFQDDSRSVAALRAAIEEAEIPIHHISRGGQLEPDDALTTIDVLHPPPEGVPGSDNANSVVLRIRYGGRCILLSGDLESPGLETLFAGPPCDADVVLAPHHGSGRSDPPGFAAWSTPEYVIISGDRSDNSPAVRAAYESRGAKVLHTAEQGAVTVIVGPDGMQVETFRSHDRSSRELAGD